MSSDPDSDVVELVAHADMTGALRELMRRYGTAVYRYCREALRDAALADDVHQQVFIQVHRDLIRFNRRSTVRTWLFAIARNRVLDAAKARRRAQAHVDDGDARKVADPRPAPGDTLDQVRLARALVDCVEELTESTRTAVLLRFQQGFTFEEMAKICGERPGTLQAKVTRALPLLRDCVELRTGGAV